MNKITFNRTSSIINGGMFITCHRVLLDGKRCGVLWSNKFKGKGTEYRLVLGNCSYDFEAIKFSHAKNIASTHVVKKYL